MMRHVPVTTKRKQYHERLPKIQEPQKKKKKKKKKKKEKKNRM